MLTTATKIMAIDKSITEAEVPLLEHFIKVAQNKIEEYCNRNFEKKTYTETISGRVINLKNYPIESISITNYYKLDKLRGIIEFSSPVSDLEVSYVAGFDEIPSEIELAVLMYYKTFIVEGEFRDFAQVSERLGDYSVNYGANLIEKMFTNTVPPVVASLVSGYRGRV